MSKRKGEGPHPIDLLAGRNLRLARTQARCSQEWLAGEVGLTFQQIQKYERGTNRIALSRAWEFAKALKINVADLFAGAAPTWINCEYQSPDFERWLELYAWAKERGAHVELVRCVESIVPLTKATAGQVKARAGREDRVGA